MVNWAGAAVALALAAAGGQAATVDYVRDGDTLELAGGTVVRLVQIDAPELRGRECYASEARRALRKLLPPGTAVRVVPDPRLDRIDRYGRRLAYVFKGRENVNRTLVERGAASVWFYRGERGRYARHFLSAARRAKVAKRGLWGACPGTRLDPLAAVSTGGPRTSTARCDSSYPDFCIPPPPPDLDCKDIGRSFTVRPPDPHGFDGDGDGRGCETYGV
jgi:micrococcal nuclease